MPTSAWVMLAIATTILVGGFTVCLIIAIRAHRSSED